MNGNRVRERDIVDFKEFLAKTGLQDLPASGYYYTWSNNHANPVDRIWCISDHSPVIVYWGEEKKIQKSFRYCNFWENLDDYEDSVRCTWNNGNNLLKSRRARNNITLITLGDGSVSTDSDIIKQEFTKYFMELLGQARSCNPVDSGEVAQGPTIVSSLLASRLKEVLPDIIDPAQGAFVKDRSIVNNIYLAQQLLNDYGKKKISERMAWKIDLRKAYDTIDWSFLTSMLEHLKFPRKFIAWMAMCMQTTSYSMMIKGEMIDFFEGKRGLQQGDPLSPFLFTIAMECPSSMLQRLNRIEGFYFHPKCNRIKLSHIMFADDLILFSSGRPSAINAIKEKSRLFAGGINAGKVSWVEEVIGTKASPMPVRYLGLPLMSRRLSGKDCDSLIEKITTVIQAVNATCARFLWRGSGDKKGGHLVKCEDVCRDKEEGGLGLKNIKVMNFSMVINHMWGKKEASKVDWYKLVWNYFNSSRDSFNVSPVVQNKLLTRDRMSHWGYTGDSTCVLCGNPEESRDHLHFECSFSNELWNKMGDPDSMVQRAASSEIEDEDDRSSYDESYEWRLEGEKYEDLPRGKNLLSSNCPRNNMVLKDEARGNQD
ncbi:hypothetical protein QQ045_021213 [Rhodiola kirilowii]